MIYKYMYTDTWFTSKKAVPNLWRMIIPRHHLFSPASHDPLHDWWKIPAIGSWKTTHLWSNKLVRPPPSRRKRWGTRNDGFFPLITSGTWMVAWGYPGPGIFWRKHHQMVQNSASFLISDLTLFSSPSSINVECWENIIDNVPLYDVECWEHINVGFWINCKWSRDPPTRVAMDVWISLKFSMSLFDDRKRLPPNGLDGRQKAYEHMVVS